MHMIAKDIQPPTRARCVDSAARSLQDEIFAKTGELFVFRRETNAAILISETGETFRLLRARASGARETIEWQIRASIAVFTFKIRNGECTKIPPAKGLERTRRQ